MPRRPSNPGMRIDQSGIDANCRVEAAALSGPGAGFNVRESTGINSSLEAVSGFTAMIGQC